MKHIIFTLTILLPSLFSSQHLRSQEYVFNRLYDYMGYWQIVVSIAEVEEGYVAAIKNTAHTYELNRIILAGLNKEGDTLWTKHYFTDSTVVNFTSPFIEKSEDGFLVLAGTIENPQLESDNKNAYMMKVDVNGNLIWQKTYGGPKVNGIRSFKKTPDNGFILGGYSRNEDDSGDFYLIKTDPDGEMEWEAHLGGTGYQSGYSVDFTPDGGYVISGRAGDPHFPFAIDIAVAKCDSLGNQLWYKVYGGEYNNDAPHSILSLTDGNMVIAGAMGNENFSYSKNRDAYLIKIDQEGEVIWENVYDEEYTTVHASNIVEAPDGNIVVAGIRYPNSDDAHNSTLSKFNENGELIWRHIYPNPNPQADTYLYNISYASDGGFLAYGSAYDPNFDNFQEGWLIKTDSEGYTCEEVNCVVVDVEEAPLKVTEELEVFPNPTTGMLNINWQGESEVQLGIYALDGTLVWAGVATGKNRQVDIGWMPAGLYFVQARGEEGLWQRKVVLVR